MKKILSLILLAVVVSLGAQTSANRFFYELTFKPKKDSARLDKVITILDITKDKSIYQDYTIPSQDSIIKVFVAEVEKTKVFKDPTKLIRMPKFQYKITKTYPAMTEQYSDRISRTLFSYDEPVKFNWTILPEKTKVGEYNTQAATTEYGGRKWKAWFSTDLPFQDGPYKFYGLPGLIVKIEDDAKNYSWTLRGNKKIDNYSELSEGEKINQKYGVDYTPKVISKDKFDSAYKNYKADPMAEFRPYMKPEVMSQKMPGSDVTMGEFFKNQEKMAKDFFNANNNPIELETATVKKK